MNIDATWWYNFCDAPHECSGTSANDWKTYTSHARRNSDTTNLEKWMPRTHRWIFHMVFMRLWNSLGEFFPLNWKKGKKLIRIRLLAVTGCLLYTLNVRTQLVIHCNKQRPTGRTATEMENMRWGNSDAFFQSNIHLRTFACATETKRNTEARVRSPTVKLIVSIQFFIFLFFSFSQTRHELRWA